MSRSDWLFLFAAISALGVVVSNAAAIYNALRPHIPKKQHPDHAAAEMAVTHPVADVRRIPTNVIVLGIISILFFIATIILLLMPKMAPDLVVERNGQLGTVTLTERPPIRADDTTKSGVFFAAEIVNHGNMQSIARDFELTATVNGTDHYVGKLEPIPPILPMPFPDGRTITFYGSDALYNKALVPIQSGGSVSGILLFVFDGVSTSTLETHRTTFMLSFKDAVNREYDIEMPLGTMNADGFSYFPGIKMAISKTPSSTEPAPRDVR